MSKDTTKSSKNVQFAESLHKEQLKYKPDQIQVAAGDRAVDLEDVKPRTPGVMDEQFPTAALTEYDPRDKEMTARLALQDPKQPGYTPFGKLIARDQDFKWLQDKQAAAEVADFERWFAQEFDLMDPAQKQRAKELYPEFYKARKKLLKIQAKNLQNLARIKLEGISSFKDLQTTYLAETGRLDLGPLQHILHPEYPRSMDEKTAKKSFVRGLANPFLVFGKEAYPATTKSRRLRAQDWEERDFPKSNAKLGIEGVGFPPFKGGDADEGDEQWFQALSKGIAGLN